MEGDSTAPVRKVKFAPKIPTRKPKPLQPKIEKKEEVDASEANDLLRRISESAGRGKPKIEKKSTPVQVAFGQGTASSFIRSYGPLKHKASGSQDGGSGSIPRNQKVYKEPWNYYTYYPTTLPLREPYMGDPVVLDEEEFGEASANTEYDENLTNPTEELGLMDTSGNERLMFLQLPSSFPFTKRSASAEANEAASDSKPPKLVARPEKGCSLEELPPGIMGKLLMYESGAVKLKLGDVTLYDVSPGSDCVFAQDVLAINTEEKHCCVVGELKKRAIVTPDVDCLLKGVADLT